MQLLIVTALVAGAASPAYAAKPSAAGGHHGDRSASTTKGNHLSYPACGATFPSAPAFGIADIEVIDGGLANDLNPRLGPSAAYPSCSKSELYWTNASSSGTTAQPNASLDVNTADPGNVYDGTPTADWPTSSSSTDPYGSCSTTTVSTSSGGETQGGLARLRVAVRLQHGHRGCVVALERRQHD